MLLENMYSDLEYSPHHQRIKNSWNTFIKGCRCWNRKKVGAPSIIEYRRLLIFVDIESVNLWRSDTVRAYTATQLHKDRVIQHCTGLSEYLRGFFSYFRFEETFDWDQKFRRLEKQVLPQIAALALKLNCSPEQYQWERYRDVGADGTLPIIIDKSHLSDFIIMDAHTHQTLNPQAARFASMQDDAPIGVFLLVVYPALFRWDPTTQSFILIQKAVVLIQGYESLPPDLKAEVDSLETEG